MRTQSWMMPVGMLLALLIYFFFGTMTSVPGGDSAMFIGAAYSGGIAQPPGYPLITLIYKFLFLFPGDSVTLINFSSGLFNSLASLCLFFLFKEVLKCTYNALILSVFFCALPLIFRYGVVAEVFALNNFLIALTLYLGHRYSTEKNIKIAFLGSFVMGLGMSHHHTFALIALPLVIWLLLNFEGLRNIKNLSLLLLFGLLGLTPYLYMLIAPSTAGQITWGETNTWDGFWFHFFRKDFGTFKLTSTGKGGFVSNIVEFFKDLPLESFGLLLILPGVWFIKKLKEVKKDSFEHLIAFTLIAYLLFFFTLANINLSDHLFKEVFVRFWQVPLLLLVVLSAYGLRIINEKWSSKAKVFFFIICLITISRAGLSFQQSSRRNLNVFEDYGKAMLNSLPQKAVLIATGDLQVNVLRFLQQVRKLRPDVVVLPIPLMDLAWYRKTHNKYFTDFELPPGTYFEKKAPGKYQIYDLMILNPQREFYMLPSDAIIKNNPAGDNSPLQTYQWLPHGFLISLKPKRNAYDPNKVIQDHKKSMASFDLSKQSPMELGSWEELVLKVNFWNAERFHMLYHTRLLQKSAFNYTHAMAIASHLQTLKDKYSPIPVEFLKNLGLIYFKMIGRNPDSKSQMLSAWDEFYKRMDNPDSKEGREIKKALDHFGKRK